RWIVDTGVPRFTLHGVFAGYIGSYIDITGRKQMEEALRGSEARYRALGGGSIQAISIFRKGQRGVANQAYVTMFGYDSLPELLGRPVIASIAPHDRARLRRHTAALLRGEREVLNLVLAGLLNKEIALRLAISQRTVELHRSRIMQKLHAESAADLA